MKISELIDEIEKLSIDKRLYVIERTSKSIHKTLHAESLDVSESDETYLELINETSLSVEWLSEEDERWDLIK